MTAERNGLKANKTIGSVWLPKGMPGIIMWTLSVPCDCRRNARHWNGPYRFSMTAERNARHNDVQLYRFSVTAEGMPDIEMGSIGSVWLPKEMPDITMWSSSVQYDCRTNARHWNESPFRGSGLASDSDALVPDMAKHQRQKENKRGQMTKRSASSARLLCYGGQRIGRRPVTVVPIAAAEWMSKMHKDLQRLQVCSMSAQYPSGAIWALWATGAHCLK